MPLYYYFPINSFSDYYLIRLKIFRELDLKLNLTVNL